MRNVVAAFSLCCEANVALDNGAFSFAGPAAQTPAKCRGAGIHGRAFRDTAIFSVLHYRHVQRGGRREGLAHDVVIENRLTVIAKGDSAGPFESGEIGKA